MIKVNVKASKEYDVLIGSGILPEIDRYISGPKKAALIADSNTGPLFARTVKQSLTDRGLEVFEYVFEAGEKSKTLKTYSEILDFLAEARFGRGDVVCALGGGVTGDMAGFAAATYMRGIGYIQIPTTLLAAVDSSVGGKTAIDLPAGKNLAGAFYQPDIVICDTDTLRSLDRRQMNSGRAEVIKYAMIADETIFDMLRESEKSGDMTELIARCVEIKRDIVQEDEFEGGSRKLLNFGHTIGHAIEKASGYEILHGEAVAAGMMCMCRGAAAEGLCESDFTGRLGAVLEENGLPLTTTFDKDTLMDLIRSDKKASGDGIDIVVPERIGKCAVKRVSFDEMDRILGAALR